MANEYKWVIFYGDGSSYDNTQGPPESAPTDNVQVIFQPNDREDIPGRGWTPCWNLDYYCWHSDAGRWLAHDEDGVRQYQKLEKGRRIILSGYNLPRQQFCKIYADGHKDPRVMSMVAVFDRN